MAIPIPNIPEIDAKNKNINLQVLREFKIFISENINPDIIVIAITIIIIGDTIPALTAASPSINAPTIESVFPATFGTL